MSHPTLSILIPVFNEKNTIQEIIRRVLQVSIEGGVEIVLIDDGSTDGTREILKSFSEHKVVFHERNYGKGHAIRTGLREATGKYVVIQDGDLEYDPRDFVEMVHTMERNQLNILYGSRRLKKENVPHSGVLYFIGGWLLTIFTNILYAQHLTDEPTCYKMFRREFIQNMPLRCERFEFCPEVTALSAKRGEKITEIPISYAPRGVKEGKKINWRDWFEAVWTLLYNRF